MKPKQNQKPKLETARSVTELRAVVGGWHAQGLRVALVPTMGALHAGHLSLVQKGLELCDRVVVSIFVNPTQFGPNEDFSRYPRQMEADAAQLESTGAHLLFAPGVEEMYPPGFSTSVNVKDLTQSLCGAFRPGHFEGVATVVTKLLLQALPDVAIFGEKDYQQLLVIRRLTRDLDIPVEIIGVPTLREKDGLAMSSRNAYLQPDERQVAGQLNRILFAMAEKLRAAPGDVAAVRQWGLEQIAEAGFDTTDYLEVRDAATLETLENIRTPARILAAVRLGKARLIDNIAV